MTLSDLEWLDVRNQLFQADLNNAGQVSHVIAFVQMRRPVCQRQLSFLLNNCFVVTESILKHHVDALDNWGVADLAVGGGGH